MATGSVLLETPIPGISVITLNRPKALNALNVPLLSELVEALRRNRNAKVIVLQGAGDRAFCSGEDLKESLAPQTGSAEELRDALEKLQDLTRLMASSPALIITVVQGYAIGGGAEIALTGDFVIGGPSAKFRFPEVVIGHAATGGITQRLPLIVGLLKAKELLLTGRMIDADECLKIGILSELVANPKKRALELGKTLAALPKTAASSSKLSLERAVFPNQEAVLQDEIHVASLCFAQHDAAGAFRNFASRKTKDPSDSLCPTDLNSALATAVREWPSRPFLRFKDADYSFAAFEDLVARMAGALQSQDVGSGDRVLVMMKNKVDMVCSWLATNRLAAVWVPINTELRSTTLKHVVDAAQPKLALADQDYLEILRACEVLENNKIFSIAAPTTDDNCLTMTAEPVTESVQVLPSTPSAFLFTSGTTGRSKPCILPHGYFLHSARNLTRHLSITKDDVLYCPFPLCHIDATALTVVPAMLMGGVAALAARYSASNFWNDIREMKVTVYDFMGATLALTYKQPPSESDRSHAVRLAWGVPVPTWAADYEARFNHPLIELYGSTEAGVPVIQQGPRIAGSCGKAIQNYNLRIADPSGSPLPPHTVGELLVRCEVPQSTFQGYYGDHAATNEVFSDMWLHTGDNAKLDEHGNLFYVGRSKDVVRRRGENVNTFEVEEELLAHPDVMSVAALPVPSGLGEGTEDDVKVVVVPREGAVTERGFSEEKLWEWAIIHMARFQVPDVIEFVPALERTATGKIEKWRLGTQSGLRFDMRRRKA